MDSEQLDGLIGQVLAVQDEQAKMVQKAIADLQGAVKQARADLQADTKALQAERSKMAAAAAEGYRQQLDQAAATAKGRMADDVQEIVAAARIATAQIMSGVRSLDRSHEGLARKLLHHTAFVLGGVLAAFFMVLWLRGWR